MSLSTTQGTLDATLDTDTQHADLDAAPVTDASQWRLLPVAGQGLQVIMLEGGTDEVVDITVGRSPKSTHVIDDKRVSKTHIKVHLENKELTIVDMSTNGTRVNGKLIAKKTPHRVVHGDIITLLHIGDKIEYSVFVPEEDRRGRDTGDDCDDEPAAKRAKLESPDAKTKEQAAAKAKAKAEDRVDESMTCGICMGLFYKPVTLLPCLHNYCAACWSGWRNKSTACPVCRVPATSVRKNHDLRNIIEAHIAAHPEKARSAEEIAEMEANDKITAEETKVTAGPRHLHHPQPQFGGGGYGSDSEESYFSGGSGGPGEPPSCAQCTVPNPQDGFQCVASQTAVWDTIYAQSHEQNGEGGVHYICCQGWHHFPARKYDPNVNPTAPAPPTTIADGIPKQGMGPVICHMCSLGYCNNYTGVPCPNGATGTYDDGTGNMVRVLSALRDHHILQGAPLPLVFGTNRYELDVLRRYVQANNISLNDAFHSTLASILDGSYAPQHGDIRKPLPVQDDKHGGAPISLDTPVCRNCVTQKVLAPVLHAYRFTIKKTDLVGDDANRDDCWYGLECRTQTHKPAHASRLNHICEKRRR